MAFDAPGISGGGTVSGVLTLENYIQGSLSGLTHVRIGSGTPAFLSASVNNFYVTGQIETGSTIYCGNQLRVLGGAIWWGIGRDQGLLASGTPSTRGGIIYNTDEGCSLVAGASDGNGNHVWQLISGDNYLKDHDHDTMQTDPTFFYHSAEDPDTDPNQWGSLRHDQSDFTAGAGTGGFKMDGIRLKESQGADVASANDLTLGSDGNVFEITGTTQINAIDTTAWVNGCVATLLFTSNPTVKHNTSGGAGTAVILLAGAADFSATAGDTLTVRLCEIGGTQAWREIGRAVI